VTDPRIVAAESSAARRTQYRQHLVLGFYWGLMMWVVFRATQVFEGKAFFTDAAVQVPIWLLAGFSVSWGFTKLRARTEKSAHRPGA
jgi:hypothetical protein